MESINALSSAAEVDLTILHNLLTSHSRKLTSIDLKKTMQQIQSKKLSFAKPEYLHNILGIEPGSVSPFALLNDTKKEVRFYLDRSFLDYKRVNFHPLINTATVNISPQNLIDLIEKYQLRWLVHLQILA